MRRQDPTFRTTRSLPLPMRGAVVLCLAVAAIILAAAAAPAAVLTVTDNLVTHFDAAVGTYTYSGSYSPAGDGDTVRWWDDQATAISGNNAAQQSNTGAQPILQTNVLNGLPVLHFSGGQNLLVLDGGTSGGPSGSSDAVGTALDTNTISWFAVVSKTGTATEDVLRAEANGRANEWGSYYENGKYISNSRPSGSGIVASSATAATDTFYVLGAVWDGDSASQTVTQWLDGAVSTAGTGADSDGTPFGRFRIGNNSSSTSGLNGDIAEVLVYDTALSASQVAAVNGYLATKYGFVTTSSLRQGILLHSTMDDRDVNRAGTNPPPTLSTNDGNWTVEDIRGTPQNGTAISDNTGGVVTSSVQGQMSQAIDFSDAKGGNRRVDYGDVFDIGPTDSRTVSFWFNSRDSDGTYFIASDGNLGSGNNGWSVWLEPSGSGKLEVRAEYTGSDNATENLGLNRDFTAADEDAWHHLALIIDNTGGLLSAYYDGMASGTSGTENGWAVGGGGGDTNVFAPGRDFTNSDPLLLGVRNDLAAEWAGMIDDFAMWDRVLTPQEISAIYASGLEGISLMAVPEPSTWAMLVMGALTLLGVAWRRRRAGRTAVA